MGVTDEWRDGRVGRREVVGSKGAPHLKSYQSKLVMQLFSSH